MKSLGKFLKSLLNSQVKDALRVLAVAFAGALLEKLIGIIDALESVPPV